jgi:hypothetical protein
MVGVRTGAARGRGIITVSDGCDLGENLARQAMTNLAERGSLGENRILKDQLKGRLMLSTTISTYENDFLSQTLP